MTVEEYLEERFKGYTYMYAYHVCNRAIEMAREEERRNAVNQLQIVLTAIVERDDSKINFGDIIDQFKELLNE